MSRQCMRIAWRRQSESAAVSDVEPCFITCTITYLLILHVVSWVAGFSAWWMWQLVSSLALESSTVAWRVCFTLNYTGWTSLNESSINWKSWSTGAYKAWRHSTWSTVAFLHQTLPVVSVSDRPLTISWSYARRRSSKFGRLAFSVAGPMVCNMLPDHLRHTSLSIGSFRSALKTFLFTMHTGTRSALEALYVMRYTN